MRLRLVAIGAIAASASLLTACGGGTGTSAPPSTTTFSHPFTYGPTPSVSALQICDEAVGDIAPVLGVATVATPHATWHDHQYTCPYHYSNGTMVLWVKELPTIRATLAYMAVLRRRLGFTQSLANVGQGGFQTKGGWTVSRKDNKVLVVDVSGLPASFGHPASARWEVAQTVTDIVFACWRGD